MNCNYSRILNYIKEKPEAYKESSSPFWDDDYISGCMLEAHLDPDRDGASRTHDFIRKSVDWIDRYCGGGNGRALLDLGCGPGLYTELFADRGFSVTGIDLSRRSVEYARKHAAECRKSITYHCQDYLSMNYENEFDVVTLIYCDMGVLNPNDRAALLRKIKRALKPGGFLIFDGFTKLFLDSFQEMECMEYEDGGFWSDKPCAVLRRNSIYSDTANTLEQYIVITEQDCACYNLWNQVYSKETMAAELEAAGFTAMEFFDDVAGKVFTGRAETVCGVGRNPV